MQFPTPYWSSDGVLKAPPGDAIAEVAAIDRASWLEQLQTVDGVPARPAFFIALSAEASGFDTEQMRLVDAAGSEVDMPLGAWLSEEGTTLVVRPESALPETVKAGALALDAGAVQGAEPLVSCAPEGMAPSEGYAEARALADAPFAVPFVRSSGLEAQRQLAESYAAAPPLKVVEAHGVALADLGDFTPSPELSALLADPTPAGLLETPLWLNDAYRAEAEPVGTTQPGFIMALPQGGSPPYPWVLVQHGGGGDKRLVFELAESFVSRGFALVGIDLLFHGDRGTGGASSGAEYLRPYDPLRMAGQFRQTSADHLAVITGAEALNAAIASITGSAQTLDPDRVFYVGHSLGALSGGTTVGVAPRIRAAALVAGGAGWEVMMREAAFALLGLGILRNRPELDQQAVMHLGQLVLDAADPLAYAARFEVTEARSVLALEAIDELYLSNASTDLLGRAWQASLALPAHHSVVGVPEATPPFSANQGGATRALVQFPLADQKTSSRHGAVLHDPAGLELIAHCFQSQLDTGSCEVIDTGWDP